MRKGKIHVRHQLLQPCRHVRDPIYAIIDIVNLPAPRNLPGDSLAYHFLIVFADVGLDRQTVLRRLLEHAHVADSHKAHVQGPGNRRCGQGQHVDILSHFLDLFLMCHAKTLLLVNDQQAQILKLHVLRQNPVRTDDDIHHAFFQV